MVHPLVPQVETLAAPVAAKLGFEVVNVIFHTNHNPPVLRVDIRPQDPSQATALEHCEIMSLALEECLDSVDLVTGNYVLEISSPGIAEVLSTERDFEVFKGFPVEVTLEPPHKGRQSWVGTLVERQPDALIIAQKGRRIKLPRVAVQAVTLREGIPE